MGRLVFGLLAAGVFVMQVGLFACAGLTALQAGEQAYAKGQYTQALSYYQQAYKAAPRDGKVAFNLGKTYARLKQYDKAKTAFDKAVETLHPQSELAAKARQNAALMTKLQVANNAPTTSQPTKTLHNVALLQQAQLSNTRSAEGDNYLSHVIHNGKVIQWDLKRMPLKVYVQPASAISGWGSTHQAAVSKAMATWSQASKQKLRFQLVQNPGQADIKVSWIKQLDENRLGLSPFVSDGKRILQADVVLGVMHPLSGGPMSESELTSTAIHEFGHALGMQGHSPYPQDVMFFSVHPQQSPQLTDRDIKTFELLYAMDADIKNSGGLSVAAQADAVLALQEAQKLFTAGKLQEALTVANRGLKVNPRDSELLATAGACYHNLGNLAQAERFYRLALQQDSGNGNARLNLATIQVNLGVDQARSQMLTAARQRFREAITLLTPIEHQTQIARSTMEIARKNLAQL